MSLLLLWAGGIVSNTAPSLTVTDPIVATTSVPVSMGASVSDDGLPSGTLTSLWAFVSGPGIVTFVDATDPNTNATFDTAGTYVVNLAASDTALSTNQNVTVIVSDPPVGGNNRWTKWIAMLWH